MTSTAPTPKGSQEQSLTEQRLQELLAKQADVVAGGVSDRSIQAREGGRGIQETGREREMSDRESVRESHRERHTRRERDEDKRENKRESHTESRQKKTYQYFFFIYEGRA